MLENCPRCGAYLGRDSMYCSKCGKQVIMPGATNTRSSPQWSHSPVPSFAERNRYKEIAKSSWEHLADRVIAVDELRRLGARKELMEIARDTWTTMAVREKAREALSS